MKRKVWFAFLPVAAAFFLALSFSACGEEETTTNDPPSVLNFALNITGTEYSVMGGGEETGEMVIPGEYNGKPVTSIGAGAFRNRSGLNSVTIPDGIRYIGEGAFAGCEGLTEIVLPDSVNLIGGDVFRDCRGLTSVTVGSGASEIGAYAFCGCSGLKNVLFHENDRLASVGEMAFANCSNLTEIDLPDSVKSIGNNAFYDCFQLASVFFGENSQLTSIGAGAFCSCYGLTSFTVGKGVISIGEGAFKGCYKLIEVWNYSDVEISAGRHIYTDDTPSKQKVADGYIFYEEGEESYLLGYRGTETQLILPANSPAGTQYEIYPYAFAYCSDLTSVTIGSGVTAIGGNAFRNCSGLRSVSFDGNSQLASVRQDAFLECGGLKKVHIADLAAWCGISFDCYGSVANPLVYAHHLYLNGEEVTDLEIPEGVTRVGAGAFCGCYGLTSVTIPEGVEIGEGAFSGCDKLIEVWNYSGRAIQAGRHIYTDDTPSKQKVADGYIFYEEGEESYLLGYRGTETQLILPANSPSGTPYEIYPYAFAYCSDLTSVTIGSGVTVIGENAFRNCSGLRIVSFDGNSQLASIGQNAFLECGGLTSVTIPDSVTKIGLGAFSGCEGLEEMTIPFVGNGFTGTNFGYIFGAVTYDRQTEYVPHSLKKVTITGGSSVEENAFCGCSGLEEIVLPSGVTSIGRAAFCGCSGLTEIAIPRDVKEIRYGAFAGCIHLEKVRFEDPNGWKAWDGNVMQEIAGAEDPVTAAKDLKGSYCLCKWFKDE